MKKLLGNVLWIFLFVFCTSVYSSELPEWYCGEFFFPLETGDYFQKGSRTVLTSWFYLKREDMNGRVYGALNFPLKQTEVEVHAICEGRVVKTYYDKFTGITIEILNPSGLLIKYGHLQEWNVKRGEYVLIGELVGWGGRTGRTSGKNLYLEANYKGQKVCISPYFNRKWYCIGDGKVDGIEYQ